MSAVSGITLSLGHSAQHNKELYGIVVKLTEKVVEYKVKVDNFDSISGGIFTNKIKNK